MYICSLANHMCSHESSNRISMLNTQAIAPKCFVTNM